MTTHYGHFDPYELDNSPNPLTGDTWGGYYCRHVSALTTECLHAKSEIAAELGWRDLQIDRLRATIERLREALESIAGGEIYPVQVALDALMAEVEGTK